MQRRIDSLLHRQSVSITVDGNRLQAFADETVGIAMMAAGRPIIARSLKYHRPRSMFCSTGTCYRCLVEIDGIPNTRACMTQVKDGMVVRTQNAFPNAQRDAFSLLDILSHHITTSFYHYRFLRPRFMRQTYLKMLKQFTGLGRLDLANQLPLNTDLIMRREQKILECEVTVVGGGISGLTAALSAADSGASVVVLDEAKIIDKVSLKETDAPSGNDNYALYHSRVRDLKRRVGRRNGITLYPAAVLLGIFEGRQLGAVIDGATLANVQTQRLIIATGAYEALPVFPNNELPGILSGRLAQQMVYDYHLRPGSKAVIWGLTTEAKAVASALSVAGTEIKGFVTCGSGVAKGCAPGAEGLGGKLWEDSIVAGATGRVSLRGVVVENMLEGSSEEVDCDLLVICHTQPRYELQVQAGCGMTFDEQKGGIVAEVDDELRTSKDWIFIAGEASGAEKGQDLCAAEGKLAGHVAAIDLGYSRGESLRHYLEEVIEYGNQIETEPIAIKPTQTRGHVCICQDVRVQELLREKDILNNQKIQNFHTELLKRHTGILTGPCQGKYCLANFLRILAAIDGKLPTDYPIPTIRPPLSPLRIKELALKELDHAKSI